MSNTQEITDFGDDTEDFANDSEEVSLCDKMSSSWKDTNEDDPENVEGEPLSLRGPEFDAIISTADSVLNHSIAVLHEKKQTDGEMTVKVTIEDCDGMGVYNFSGAVSGKINYTVKPQKIACDAVELKFDAEGHPIVSADREHQLNFDEIQPGQRKIPPSGTVTVDVQTGIVEDYESNVINS